jgi:hypothetical protein
LLCGYLHPILLINMERFLLVQIIVIGFILVFAFQLLARSDGNFSPKWAKIRVRVEEDSRRFEEPPEEEDFDPQGLYTWLILAVILFFFVLLLVNG